VRGEKYEHQRNPAQGKNQGPRPSLKTIVDLQLNAADLLRQVLNNHERAQALTVDISTHCHDAAQYTDHHDPPHRVLAQARYVAHENASDVSEAQ